MTTDRQCPSCGGFCKKSGCERENVTAYASPAMGNPISPMKVIPLAQKRNDLQSLVNDIKKVVYERSGRISMTEAIGALEIAKMEVYEAAK